MKNSSVPQDQVRWYLESKIVPQCQENITTDVVIIGGGMAGLHAAQAWSKRGKKVVLLEQYYCGSGATGKSSGFITPNAELSFTDFSKKYTPAIAHTIWDFITSGVNDIRTNIQQYGFSCGYVPQDTLMVATTKRALKEFEIEHENLAKFGYKTAFYTKEEVGNYLNSPGYWGGMTYEETFGINAYQYCQDMKNYLQKNGVMIFEETPVVALEDQMVITPHARLTADYIVVCTDRFMPELGLLAQQVYHAQTFLMISEELSERQIREIFPRKNLLVWDSELVYNYLRITSDNRLLLGGGEVLTTYSSQATHDNERMFAKLTRYFATKFPGVTIQFTQMWPGLIGISKDIVPLAGPDKTKPFLYYVSAAAGLPIAAALGRYSAEHMLEGKADLDSYFSPYRPFRIRGALQSLLGTRLSFALCNGMEKVIP
jgi:gamma-glutamylputrescine oxidase